MGFEVFDSTGGRGVDSNGVSVCGLGTFGLAFQGCLGCSWGVCEGGVVTTDGDDDGFGDVDHVSLVHVVQVSDWGCDSRAGHACQD